MAREIAKEFKGVQSGTFFLLGSERHLAYGWTQTHGFFAIMGGFILVDVVKVEGRREFKEIHTLLPRACFSSHFYESDTLPRVLESLPEEDFPIVTEKRIKDMSKGDLLSKGFALWQTAWFVLQIIARAIERLPITELEITTLAYAVLNVITYALWWNKPLGVEQPFPVLRRIPPISASTKSEELQSELKPSDEPSSSAPKTLDPMRDEKEDLAETDPGDSIGSAPYSETSSLALINPQHSPDEPSLSHPRSVAESVRRGWSYLSSFPEPIWDFVTSIFDAISTFLDGDIELQEGDKRVPTFYRGVTGSGGVEDPAFWTGFIITTIFGAIHCIAWSFHFPTHAEQLIWRVSSLVITCFAASEILLLFIGIAIQAVFDSVQDTIDFLTNIVVGVVVSLYVAARVALLVLALIELRALPPGAYETVYWTAFIPHI